MKSSGAHLFVYGTLTSAAPRGLGRGERDRLYREARPLGAATIHGRLFDLGRYPGLVDGREEADTAHGEAFLLTAPDTTFAWLDIYEGCHDSRCGRDDYARVLRQIRLVTGETLTAWVYLYRKVLVRARRIPSGRWQPGAGL
jgi:gamma-glutamylcyclotransferase (GGCT)/AIG2-like uncharacterized protein YtfP